MERGSLLSGGAKAEGLYLRPVGLMRGGAAERARAAGLARPLAGGPLAFAGCELLRWIDGSVAVESFGLSGLRAWAAGRPRPVREAVEAALERLSRPRRTFAGLPLDRPLVMGVLNVTPDSFSDGGAFLDCDRAVAHGASLLEAGADLIDVGGESTRPGAAPVDPEEELRRVLPVVRALAERGAVVSVDTRRGAVMAAALAAGARAVNDVTALRDDPEALSILRRHGASVVLMHMQGEPRTMQIEPRYRSAPLEVFDFLAERLAACLAAGLAPDRIALDPGIGFGKTVAHNLELIDGLALLHGLGCPLLLGVSRKSFIARLSRGEPAADRLAGSLAAALAGLERGVQILRVHDVAETAQARAVWLALGAAG